MSLLSVSKNAGQAGEVAGYEAMFSTCYKPHHDLMYDVVLHKLP